MSEHDYPDGDYWHKRCGICRAEFLGQKRDRVCKLCYVAHASAPVYSEAPATPAEACRECNGSRVQVAEHVLPCPVCTEPASPSEDGKQEHPLLKRLSEHGEEIALKATVMQQATMIKALQAGLAAKDAEIARLNLELKDAEEQGEREEMRANDYAAQLAELRAQPARQVMRPIAEVVDELEAQDPTAMTEAREWVRGRQVGGDEREAIKEFKALGFDFGPATPDEMNKPQEIEKLVSQINAMHQQENTAAQRAALTPAAVVMPKRPGDFYLHEPGYQRGWVAHQIEVARLNRNPIPLELLERIANNPDAKSFIGKELDELRALLEAKP